MICLNVSDGIHALENRISETDPNIEKRKEEGGGGSEDIFLAISKVLTLNPLLKYTLKHEGTVMTGNLVAMYY